MPAESVKMPCEVCEGKRFKEEVLGYKLNGKNIAEVLEMTCRKANGKLPIRHANLHNLRNVSVDIPTGVLNVVTGVAGSGKSSLINDVFLSQHPDAVVIDQSAVGVSTRSNPATYTGIMDDVRKAFASANKVNQGLFSFNSKGACENCQGLGVVYTDLSFFSCFSSSGLFMCVPVKVPDSNKPWKLPSNTMFPPRLPA